MPRAIVLVLDSLGVGATADAESFGDSGANTFGHIANWCEAGGQSQERNTGSLVIPNLLNLGLAKSNLIGSGEKPLGLMPENSITSLYAACAEISTGKDTPSGHWEMMGVPVRFDWGYFPQIDNCFPENFIEEFKKRCGLKDLLGLCHASGTQILKELGQLHIESNAPICYTSADSVFQIAAHEDTFGLERLYEICEIARELLNGLNIGRIIARPFIGKEGNFQRTGNRRDFTTPPHEETLLDKLVSAGREVHSVGKIADIFAHRGFTHKTKATGHDGLFEATINSMKDADEGSLIFTNFVEFDQSFGHRRNIGGYAAALEHFDRRLPEIMEVMKEEDILILTADHGCDPTWPGSEHTRENVPFLLYCPTMTKAVNAGLRTSFCDIGQTIAKHLKIAPLAEGISVL